ncbi:DMT family transporter [Ruicaihuangia caeni]|uniref:Multidrug efflux SMR transporter n=1 Tax=Ruicaihuangia caeni TaxID=3042517 RepID=A0AAW6T8H1_9MICO|nr:multidrug efflux SMR transporter [Klugiella sp. YN-L-19]MDI2098363.1 multidrug efflux SMR transporter [Klugiella sp. YN-L-19]
MNAAWLVLLMSAALEAVWATALGQSNGFTEPVPTVVFLVAGTLSIGGLGIAMKRLPISVAYAVWTGLGAALTVSYAMLTGEEPFSVVKVLLLAGLLGCVIGLKLVGTREGDHDSGAAAMTKTPE